MSWLFESGGQTIGALVSALVILMHIQNWVALGLTDHPVVQGTLKSLLQLTQFENINSWALSLLYVPTLTSICDYWKKHSFDYLEIFRKVTSLLLNMLSRSVTAFFPRYFPDSSVGKEFTCNPGEVSWIPGSGRSAGEGIGYSLQYPWTSLVAQLVNNPPTMWDTLIGKIPSRRERLPTPVFWCGEDNGLYRLLCSKESDVTEWLSHSFFFLPRSKHLLISWVQSLCMVILEPKKIKFVTASTFSTSVLQWSDGTKCHDLIIFNVSFKPAFLFFSFTLSKSL